MRKFKDLMTKSMIPRHWPYDSSLRGHSMRPTRERIENRLYINCLFNLIVLVWFASLFKAEELNIVNYENVSLRLDLKLS